MEIKVKMTQCDEILEYLKEHGHITRLSAACDLHIFELASRIGELEKRGYAISRTRATYANQNGRISHFTVYGLED